MPFFPVDCRFVVGCFYICLFVGLSAFTRIVRTGKQDGIQNNWQITTQCRLIYVRCREALKQSVQFLSRTTSYLLQFNFSAYMWNRYIKETKKCVARQITSIGIAIAQKQAYVRKLECLFSVQEKMKRKKNIDWENFLREISHFFFFALCRNAAAANTCFSTCHMALSTPTLHW